MKKLFILFALAILTSCARKHTESLEKSTEKVATVYIKQDTIIPKDTLVRINGDSTRVTAMVEPDREGKINLPELVMDSHRSKVSVKISDGHLEVKATCKELEEKIQLQEHRITELTAIARDAKKEKAVTQTIQQRYTPKWVKVLAWIGALSLLFIIYLLFKPLLKIITNGKI
jgi:hypothetical protein